MASRYNCVNTYALSQLKKLAQMYEGMSDPETLKAAAAQAGAQLRDEMQKRVEGEHSLPDHQDVGQALQVYEDEDGLSVGIPADHPLRDKAQEMHGIYQLTDVTQDLEQQSGNAERAFYAALRNAVS